MHCVFGDKLGGVEYQRKPVCYTIASATLRDNDSVISSSSFQKLSEHASNSLLPTSKATFGRFRLVFRGVQRSANKSNRYHASHSFLRSRSRLNVMFVSSEKLAHIIEFPRSFVLRQSLPVVNQHQRRIPFHSVPKEL